MHISLIIFTTALATTSYAAPQSVNEMLEVKRSLLQPSTPLTCEPDLAGSVDDANWCANYLIGLGTKSCVVYDQGRSNNCAHGNIAVCGMAAAGLPSRSTSSYCRDVGIGVQNIIKACQSNGKVGGFGAANGNGNYNIVLGMKQKSSACK